MIEETKVNINPGPGKKILLQMYLEFKLDALKTRKLGLELQLYPVKTHSQQQWMLEVEGQEQEKLIC